MWVETKFRSGSVRSLVLCFSPRRGCVTVVNRNPTITPGWKVFMDGRCCTKSVAGSCCCPWAGLDDLNLFAKVFWNISCNSIERSLVSAVACGPAPLYCSASLWGPALHSDGLMNKLRFVQILLDILFYLLIYQQEALMWVYCANKCPVQHLAGGASISIMKIEVWTLEKKSRFSVKLLRVPKEQGNTFYVNYFWFIHLKFCKVVAQGLILWCWVFS